MSNSTPDATLRDALLKVVADGIQTGIGEHDMVLCRFCDQEAENAVQTACIGNFGRGSRAIRADACCQRDPRSTQIDSASQERGYRRRREVMNGFYAIAMVLLIALAGYIWFDLTMTKWGIQMRQDFEKEFPGRCGYCAFVEYGIMHGHEEPDARPKPHACKENMRRWRGVSLSDNKGQEKNG